MRSSPIVAITFPPGWTLDEIRRQAVVDCLRRHGGNRTDAAAELDIGVRTLQRWLRSWGIQDLSPGGRSPDESDRRNGVLDSSTAGVVCSKDGHGSPTKIRRQP